jgi:hypothetical protein
MAEVDPLNRHCQIVARRLGTGSVIPFLGAGANLCGRPANADWQAGRYPPSGHELAEYLAGPYGYPEPDRDLLRVSQWVDLVSSPRALVDELHTVFSRDYPPNKLHAFLARVPDTLRTQGSSICGQLILTTNYDDLLERAFVEAEEPVDVVVYETRRGEQQCSPRATTAPPGSGMSRPAPPEGSTSRARSRPPRSARMGDSLSPDPQTASRGSGILTAETPIRSRATTPP